MAVWQFRSADTRHTTFAARMMGRRGAAAAHHYLAAQAAIEILRAGGNAIDAAVAATLVEGVVDPHMNSIGGEAPMIVHVASTGKVHVINGNTIAPAGATVEAFRGRGLSAVPDEGVISAGVPAAFSALLTALMHFGTMPFHAVVAPALDAAGGGFPLHRGLLRQEGFGLIDLVAKFRQLWPSSAEIFLPEGEIPREGQLICNPDLADLYQSASEAERGCSDRKAGLQKVHDLFYKGDVASVIDRFSRDQGGVIARADLEHYAAREEEPLAVEFGCYEVFKCGYWNQGPAMLQALKLLQTRRIFDLHHNSGEYIHEVVESIKLAYADRNRWYGDPQFISVPALLSRDYIRQRSELISHFFAIGDSQAGDPGANKGQSSSALLALRDIPSHGTVHVDVVDAAGNMVSCTPSGGWLKSSPVVPGLGFPLTNRLMTFHLGPPDHPNLLAAGKQPRTTISPSLALLNGRPRVAFGSMGGDMQDQWQLQFFLNMAVFDMDIQEAIEAPKFTSTHFETFFAPHQSEPQGVRVEPRIQEEATAFLSRAGHAVEVVPDWTEGFLVAAGIDPATGTLEAGCDPRCAKSEIFSPAAICW